MKKGINLWALPPMSVSDRIRLAGKLGFDGIELSITKEGELSINADDRQLEELREHAEQAGVEIVSVACSLNWQCSLTSNIESYREQAKENIRRQIYTAKKLGATAVLALPGFVGLDFKSSELFADPNAISYYPGEEIIDYCDAYERAQNAFRELAPYAEENKVVICVENIWGKFLLSPVEMRGFLDGIDSPYVKCYFDVANVLLYGYPQHWIRALGSRVERVHFKDFKRGTAMLSGFVDLLTGDVDFKEVYQALKDIGYNGWVTAEINAYKQYPEQTALNCLAALKRIVGEQ